MVKSRYITKGYLQYDNAPFSVEDDGTVTFHTGDIYGYVEDQRLVWRGRKEDYIQVSVSLPFITLVHTMPIPR